MDDKHQHGISIQQSQHIKHVLQAPSLRGIFLPPLVPEPSSLQSDVKTFISDDEMQSTYGDVALRAMDGGILVRCRLLLQRFPEFAALISSPDAAKDSDGRPLYDLPVSTVSHLQALVEYVCCGTMNAFEKQAMQRFLDHTASVTDVTVYRIAQIQSQITAELKQLEAAADLLKINFHAPRLSMQGQIEWCLNVQDRVIVERFGRTACDMQILIGAHLFDCHRCMLVARSEYFRNVLSSRWGREVRL